MPLRLPPFVPAGTLPRFLSSLAPLTVLFSVCSPTWVAAQTPEAPPAAPPSSAPPEAPAASEPPTASKPASAAPRATKSAARAEQRSFPPLPSLPALLEKTKKAAPEIAWGEASLKASRATGVGARRAPLGNPLLTVFAEHGRGVTEDIYIEGQLDLPIEIWGQRGKRIAESDAFIAYNQAELEVARASSYAEAISAYGQVLVALEKIEVLEDAITSAQTEADVYRARLEYQDATQRDTHLAAMEVARNQVLLVEAHAELQEGLAKLHRLTGEYYDAQAGAQDPTAPDALLLRDQVPLENSPSVRSSKAQASYYSRVSERASSEGKMPVSLILRGLRGDMAEARFGGGLSIGLPFFQYNQGERARAEAEAERARISATIQERALETALLGIERELKQLKEAFRVLEETALPSARNAVTAAEEIQKAGKGDLLPVLISRRDYAALRLRRLDILSRQWLAVANLVRITGVTP